MKLWQIFVPTHDNNGKEFPIEHHKTWDTKVRVIAGGLTINRKSKGLWQSPVTGKIFKETMIPVTVHCNRHAISMIAQMTLHHYDQKAVMCYKVSDEVLIFNKEDNEV